MTYPLLQLGTVIALNGAKVIEARRYSDNPHDSYLQIVLARMGDEYVTWVYNADKSCCTSGHYFENLLSAVCDYLNR